jgi:hypothetical protein
MKTDINTNPLTGRPWLAGELADNDRIIAEVREELGDGPLKCSSCGTPLEAAPHHVANVLKTGQCIL